MTTEKKKALGGILFGAAMLSLCGAMTAAGIGIKPYTAVAAESTETTKTASATYMSPVIYATVVNPANGISEPALDLRP
jgi:hypothetical protein